MPSLKPIRRNKRKEHKHEAVTGNFELHYEDIVHKHRTFIIAVFASALVLLAVFVPKAVYHTIAEPEEVRVEVESGKIENPDQVMIIHNDTSASGNGYIEFKSE